MGFYSLVAVHDKLSDALLNSADGLERIQQTAALASWRGSEFSDRLPFDLLAKISAHGTLALGAIPAAVICVVIVIVALLAVLQVLFRRTNMGIAMRAHDARDVFKQG